MTKKQIREGKAWRKARKKALLKACYKKGDKSIAMFLGGFIQG